MNLPLDWDKPGNENKRLCSLFGYESYADAGLVMPYRIFRADTERQLPLVVYLHGADAVGNDNELPLSMHEIGTMFARKEWQERHPCHILAPQYDRGCHWSMDEMEAAVHGLVSRTMEQLNADKERIYLYGYSAGGIGALRYLKAYPQMYAGAIAICGATGSNGLENLAGIPLWLVHAEDDHIVKATYREGGELELRHYGSRDLYGALHEKNPALRYTEYPAGYMKEHYGVNPHCSWVAVSDKENTEFAEWLFEQRMEGMV